MFASGVIRLPVAGIDVVVRTPAGIDELLIVENAPDFAAAVRICDELVARADGVLFAWADAAVTDLDAAVLWLRRAILGDTIRADVRCECGERVDIAFSIADYVEHHRPLPSDTARGDEPGWFCIATTEFRIPRANDQLAIARSAEPVAALLDRCTRSGVPLDDNLRQRIEVAMELLAPSLCDELEGTCPKCSAIIGVTFDPLEFSLRELRDHASTIYEDVCAIAHHYHWSETDILALPATRRGRYAELARGAR